MESQTIELDRGEKGLGFNIKGGTDQQHIPSDDGIFVTKIRDDGAAAVDGRLQKGDRILEINGVDVEKVLHKQAVDLFLNAGNQIVLKVVHGAEQEAAAEAASEVANNKPKTTSPTDGDANSGSSRKYILLTLTVAAVIIGVFVAYKKGKFSNLNSTKL